MSTIKYWNFAAYKAGMMPGERLTWEFPARMRPGLQPMIAYGISRLVAVFTGPADPFVATFLMRLLSVSIMLLVLLGIYYRYATAFTRPTDKRWFALIVLFSWLVYYVGVRFSSENWSGMFFMLGVLAYPLPKSLGPYAVAGRSRLPVSSAFLTGVLFGLSFEFRYQMALAAMGFGLWLVFAVKPEWKKIGSVIAGGVLALLVGSVADYWLYGEWVLAPWRYLDENLLQGKAADYGSLPWYAYIEFIFERGVPPLSIVYLSAIAYFCYRYRRDPNTWAFLAFFIAHSALARKDARFLFPAVYFLPLALAILFRDLRATYGPELFRRGWRKYAFGFLVVMNLLLLASVAVRHMNAWDPAIKWIYHEYDERPVTLFANSNHVYGHIGLRMEYYRPVHGYEVVYGVTDKLPPCPEGRVCLLSEFAPLPAPPARARLVYTTRPWVWEYVDWIEPLARVKFWWVYEVDR